MARKAGESDVWTLAATQECADLLASGEISEIDLSEVPHGRGRHADLLALSTLGWWILGRERDLASTWTLRTPAPEASAFLPIVRSGLFIAAEQRELRIIDGDGHALSAETIRSGAGQDRLPNNDWATADGFDSGGVPKVRMICDLTDPRRLPQPKARGRRFPWLRHIGLRSPSISEKDFELLLADVDLVIYELIHNVHRWSEAELGYAVVSVTTGGGGAWARLHVVVADTGLGIPTTLRRDLAALAAISEIDGRDDQGLRDIDDDAIVETLLRQAYGSRDLPHHNGDGLHVAQHRSSRWAGRVDVVTVACDGTAIQTPTKGVNAVGPSESLSLPNPRGTLVHLLVQAASGEHREQAAAAEELDSASLLSLA